MKRTVTQLADGRELIYFDATDDVDRSAPDRADLPPPPPAPEMRLRPVHRRVGRPSPPHRQTRTFLPPSADVPTVPVHAPAASPRSRRLRLRRGRVREPVSRVQRRSRDRQAHAADPVRPAAAGARSSASPPTTTSSFAALDPARVRLMLEALADRTAELSAHPDRRAGVLLREPRRRDRRDPAPPARPDLRLPVRHPAHPQRMLAAAAARSDRRQPVRRRARRRTRRRTGWSPRTSTGSRSSRPPPAGPSRSTCSRAARCPTCPALDDAARDAFGPLYLDVLRALRRAVRHADALHLRPGTRRRYARTATLATCTCGCSRIRRAPSKLKYLAGSEAAMGVFVNDVRPEAGRVDAARGGRMTDARAPRRCRPSAGSFGGRTGGDLGGAGPGQPDRRAHRLQRRLRAAVRAAAAHRGRGRVSGTGSHWTVWSEAYDRHR